MGHVERGVCGCLGCQSEHRLVLLHIAKYIVLVRLSSLWNRDSAVDDRTMFFDASAVRWWFRWSVESPLFALDLQVPIDLRNVF